MIKFPVRPHPVTPESRWRYRFALLTALATIALMAWGAFVTSIKAGLAVPDWPSSFNSYDPFNPWPEWWTITPVLAEHGHRLIGAVVGLLTIGLAVWTWIADPRRWMRWLGVGALALVIGQGVLGGLRVVLVSLDLAVVHACIAQIYFSLIVAIALFTSRGWLKAADLAGDEPPARRLRVLAVWTVAVLYVQIILGALLRHPGTGIDPFLAGLHITGAVISVGVIFAVWRHVLNHFMERSLIHRATWALFGLLAFQFTLGFTAFFVTLDGRGMLEASNLQVVLNSTHMVVGALLLASAVIVALLALRARVPEDAVESAERRILEQPA